MGLSETDEKFLILESATATKRTVWQREDGPLNTPREKRNLRVIYTTWISIISSFPRKEMSFFFYRIRFFSALLSFFLFSFFFFFNSERCYNERRDIWWRRWEYETIWKYDLPFYLRAKCHHIAWNGSCNFAIAWHWMNWARLGMFRVIPKSHRAVSRYAIS